MLVSSEGYAKSAANVRQEHEPSLLRQGAVKCAPPHQALCGEMYGWEDWGRGNMISMQQLQSLTIEKLVSEIYKVNPNFDAELSPCFPSPVGEICVITYPSSNRAPTARFRSGANKTVGEAIAEIIGPHVES